ncbi:C-GCAxxG-C-C family protein [uncultured Bacteroides sp.]|uniref:C-GCAxxG-C-C family protein n=1 Tax=uncultured Bacteroides sp. TaxID=162156 RepID=UPI00262C813F|nr:C-GCAxxG-C-C family protein [uncultured Bacteroides sp.]
MTKEERIEKAVALFKEGYNCAQSVVAAYADLYGFTQEQALRMAASFGGGIGRMRETCGAACGMFLLAGLERCAVDGADREGKSANYALVQELAEKFKNENRHLRCADLLGLSKKEPVVSEAEARTPQYYAKRPCTKMVESGARIFGNFLESIGKL